MHRLSISSSNVKSNIFSPWRFALVSLFIIIILFQQGLRSSRTAPSIASPSLFTAREHKLSYARARRFQKYPYAHICSTKARHRFLKRFNFSQRPLGVANIPLSIPASKNRVFVSSIPHEIGDGLGHRMCILNYELHMALKLGVSYIHRISSYGSLTKDNPAAVEDLFGWGDGETARSDLLKKACAEIAYINDTCEIPASNVVCSRLRLRTEGGLFDRIVMVPDYVGNCYLERGPNKSLLDDVCFPLMRRFLSAFPEPNTLFQMTPGLCFREYLYTNFTHTAGWFHDKYWARHSKLLVPRSSLGESSDDLDAERKVKKSSLEDLSLKFDLSQQIEAAGESISGNIVSKKTRQISFNPRRVHVALHIRRGDFFNYTNRLLLPDATYADMAARVKIALDEMVDANVPVTIHIYSEGVPKAKMRLKDNHDISSMDSTYVNEKGMPMPDDHWRQTILKNVRLSTPVAVGRGVHPPDIRVVNHIAADTVQSLHEMLAADFFVGSISGLSMHVVRNLARGLTLLPLSKAHLGKDEFTVPFDYERNAIPSLIEEKTLYSKVADYVRRNRLACSVR